MTAIKSRAKKLANKIVALPLAYKIGLGAVIVAALFGGGTALNISNTANHQVSTATQTVTVKSATPETDASSASKGKQDQTASPQNMTTSPQNTDLTGKPAAGPTTPKVPNPQPTVTPPTPTASQSNGKLILSNSTVSVERGTTLYNALTAKADDDRYIGNIYDARSKNQGTTRVYAFTAHDYQPSPPNVSNMRTLWSVSLGSFDNDGTYTINLEATDYQRTFTAVLTVYVYSTLPICTTNCL